jgi:Flp pilus assembly pilin Flp
MNLVGLPALVIQQTNIVQSSIGERNQFMFAGLAIKVRSKKRQCENGQDLAEYSLLIGLIALVVIISVSLIGVNISSLFSVLANYINY